MKKNKKILLLIGGSILLIFIGIYALFSLYYNQLNYKTADEISSEVSSEMAEEIIKEEQIENAVDSDIKDIENLNASLKEESKYDIISNEDVINILLIGTDNRTEKDRGRSDATMILSINSKEKTITLTSVLRDIYVEIPGYNNNKLNASYAFGGVSLLKETLKENFKIEIDRYVIVDFFEFIDIVDILGGVNLDISKKEMEYINQYVVSTNELQKLDLDSNKLKEYGNIHLNGTQALAYSRIRYIGTDFGRTERQRKVLEQLFENMKTSDFTTLNKLYFEIAPNVTTDMTESETLGLLFQMIDFKNYKTTQNYIPYENTYEFYTVNKMSVIGINFDENIKRFNELVYGIKENENTNNSINTNKLETK